MASQGKDKRLRLLLSPLTFPRAIYESTAFKRNLQSVHAMRPLVMEGLCEGYSPSDHLEVRNAGFEMARQANGLDFKNHHLLSQVPSEKESSLEKSWRKDTALAEPSYAREEVGELGEEVQALKDAATRHPKEIWVVVEN
ncbi:hypothetical protein LIER_27951 [Lithospermum erythrorhizon]|uniref:Uncharacterized protein n=1 Tax=Lithospermum erythrorhizon TaxID=34254 RepID=A0AAV3RGV4_LITER